MKQPKAILDQDLIARLIARPRGEDPVVSLYLRGWGTGGDRKATLKNLVKEGEEQIEADTGWDPERKKFARAILERLRERAEGLLPELPVQGRGAHALFGGLDWQEALELPVDLRDRIVVDRSPYASPLSSLIDQYERYHVVLCDQKRARLFDMYLGQVDGWEEISDVHEPSRGIPAGGPARHGGAGPAGKSHAGGAPASRPRGGGGAGSPAVGGGYHGLEELRRRNHAEYVLHQHLQHVADRAFRRFKLRPFDRLILGGPRDVLPLLEEHLHSYLKPRIVAREGGLPVDLSQSKARELCLEIENRVEGEKERELLDDVANRLGGEGLACSGIDESLRSLFFGKVHTLIVQDDGETLPGRECPECRFIFPRPEDRNETTPTLVECPVCKRATRRVPDVIDEAVELAILSGARVEHVAYAKDQLDQLGGMAALLRFK